jgi:hypothetical protein
MAVVRRQTSVTRIQLVHKHFSAVHLEEVKDAMRKLGAPRIRCIYSELNNQWVAIEGCHRLRAAKDLGLKPIIVDISNNKTAYVQGDLGRWATRKVSDLLMEGNDDWLHIAIDFATDFGDTLDVITYSR